jgi:DNA-directed RNA polymerase specialized sigma24 family protein
MLMKAYVDYSQIKPEHEEIHLRLQNWARWARGGSSALSHPMWRFFREKESSESAPLDHIPVNSLDAHMLEKLVVGLPEKQRHAVRWWYVYANNPKQAAKLLGVTMDALSELVHDARTMLKNRSKPVAIRK